MNEPERPEDGPETANGDEPSQGPSLILLYSLVALALALAIACAAMIVLPFYHRHTL